MFFLSNIYLTQNGKDSWINFILIYFSDNDIGQSLIDFRQILAKSRNWKQANESVQTWKVKQRQSS